MNKFLNYTVRDGLRVTTYRACGDTEATVTDFRGIVEAVSADSEEPLVCALNGDEIELLGDADYWKESDVTLFALGYVHTVLLNPGR